MPRFNPEEYETVDQRTQRWYRDFPEGRVESELIFKDEVPTDDEPHRVRWGFKSSVFRTSDPNEPPAGQGHAFEIDGGGGANRASALENCETSATGRALAQAGYSGSKRTTREEMLKVRTGEVTDRIKKAQSEDDLTAIYNDLQKDGIEKEFLGALGARKKDLLAKEA